MGVFCQIFVHKTKEGIHKPGQPVSGIIKYAIDKPTTYKRIVVSLTGRGKCSWTERDGDKNNIYIGNEDYVSQHLEVLNTSDSSTIINTGSYEFPFHFVLPEDIPSSVKNKTCTIKYLIEIKFMKPGIFSFDRKYHSELTVYGSVTNSIPEGPVVFGLQKSLFKPFSVVDHKISLKAEIDKTFLTPGENARVNYTVMNNSDTSIKSIVTSIVCHTTYTANCGRTNVEKKTLPASVVESPGVTGYSKANQSVVIPILPELYSIQHSKIMVREYKVTVTVKLPMPHINDAVDIAVVVGERGRGLEVDFDEEDDQLPSYWEAMSEGKDTEASASAKS